MDLYPVSRKRLAHKMARQVIRIRTMTDIPYDQGVYHGLWMACDIAGFSLQQQANIVQAANDWAAANCPAVTSPPPGPQPCRGCQAPCHCIPLDRRDWRAL